MRDEIKNTLEKQLALLSERSMKSESVEEIVSLTEQMTGLAILIDSELRNQFFDAAPSRLPSAALTVKDLADMLVGRSKRYHRLEDDLQSR